MNVSKEETRMDKSETIGQSLVQHGSDSRRVYLMHLHPGDFPDIIDNIEALAQNNGYTKIFSKIPARFGAAFKACGYEMEAMVPGFFKGLEDALFMVRYLDASRRAANPEELNTFQKMLLSPVRSEFPLLEGSHRVRLLNPKDAPAMTKVFKQVFHSYPFPIFDPSFLIKGMQEETRFFGVFHNNQLVGISSSECNNRLRHAEMTDFAVLPDQRGKNLAVHLLKAMEIHLKENDFKTFYTIARLKSLSMNKTFMNLNYKYSGTLVNNTQIAGHIESMNVWYKNV